jgi:hypothetical protein
MNEREQIISFLLQSADAKNTVIADLQRKNAELTAKVKAFEDAKKAEADAKVPQAAPIPIDAVKESV